MRESGGNALAARLDGALRLVENGLGIIAGAVLTGTMVLVTVDAVSRHFFAAPLTFAYTLTEAYLMGAGIALALPWGYRTGGRIRIALLTDSLPHRVQLGLFRFGSVLALPYLAAMCWLSAGKTYEAFANNEYTMGIIDWPVGWSWIWVPIGLAFLAARVLIDLFRPVEFVDATNHN